MSKTFSMQNFRLAVAGAVVIFTTASAPTIALAAGEGNQSPEIERQHWTFSGLSGYFDKAQLRRGYLVYKNVCATCHGMRLLYFRNLSEPGGPLFSEARMTGFAADASVTDGPNDEGEMFTRPGLPADNFVSPYPNEKAAAAAQGGAIPPDLSVMAKARSVPHNHPWYTEPYYWLTDIFTGYQEQGPDYMHALLLGYKEEPPEGVNVLPGLYYNEAFPGFQIAMPPPLFEGAVEYEDGTAPTLENYASDVSAFLMWAAEPKLEERKKMGLTVLVYLAIFAVLLFLSKRTLWRKVPH